MCKCRLYMKIYVLLCMQISLVHPVFSNATIKSVIDCELFIIDRDVFSDLLTFYPEGRLCG